MISGRDDPFRWLLDEAAPFWADLAWDERHGGYVSRLSPDGAPTRDDPKTTLVHARMLLTCAHVLKHGGAETCRAGAHQAFAYLTATLWNEDRGGFVKAVAADGAAEGPGAEPVLDAYDHAFVLLGLAALHEVEPAGEARSWIERTRGALLGLADERAGGYHENSRAFDPGEAYPLPRRQNPHMHLLEAFLALREATGETRWIEEARAMLDLFDNRFLDNGTGSLREFLDRDLNEAPAPLGRIREPGHQFEWVWLLDRYAALSGDRSRNEAARALYGFGTAHGVLTDGPLAGGVLEAVSPSGEPITPSLLLWPQTEGVKAHLARYEATGETAFLRKAQALMRLIFESFVRDGQPLWRNQIDAEGRTMERDAPTRLLYHVALAVTEGRRLGAW